MLTRSAVTLALGATTTVIAAMRLLLALALSVGSAAQAPPNGGKSKDFPPGFNGEARTPRKFPQLATSLPTD